MTAQLLDGKALATKLRGEISTRIKTHLDNGGARPGLAVILVGDDPASAIYVRNKREACAEVGIQSFYHPLPASISETELIALIKKLNSDATVSGILLQLPLPDHIHVDTVIECINPQKDVDGFHPYNFGRLAQRSPLLRPCTPLGIITLLDSIQETYKNRHAVIIGASNIVGRPMALELLIAGSTVTVCHRFTENLAAYVSQGDIVISATGKPRIIQGEWIKSGATVIDVGISRLSDGSMSGDVEFETARQKAAWITPVPGGVGPMTVVSLLKNTLQAANIVF